MTPELEAALEPLGWSHLKAVAPTCARRLEHRLLSARDDDRPRRSKAELEKLKSVRAAMIGLFDGLAALSSDSLALIDHWSCPPEKLAHEVPPYVASVREALEAIVPGILQLSEVLAAEAQRIGRGRRKNEAAHRIADVLAEIHVIGRGEAPRLGRDQATYAATGDFGRVSREVFQLLGVSISHSSVEPLESAIAALSPNRMDRLLAHRSGSFSREPLSLFDLYNDRGK